MGIEKVSKIIANYMIKIEYIIHKFTTTFLLWARVRKAT